MFCFPNIKLAYVVIANANSLKPNQQDYVALTSAGIPPTDKHIERRKEKSYIRTLRMPMDYLLNNTE